MPDGLARKIYGLLSLFPEVQWDRWSGDIDDLSVFGWIDRPQDTYKDFVELAVIEGEPESISTSSALYSAEFCQRLSFDHNDCKRVESAPFAPMNCIRLNKAA